MYLKSLELFGFKSFAKKAGLKFTTPITAIVGPNGSGKSNTAEAFRFVLGEQSIKSLRGKRGEDMIWNGGGEGPGGSGRANRASVKLIFDNRSKLFPALDFDEVSLERVVNRDNTNEYLLNGSQVRLKDIVEILAAAHIGSTGHHIISQGEADRILGASISERRLMIEDALGLKIYQWKKLESLRKMEKTEENMRQVESLRREIAPHLKFLEKQVEKVAKAEELRRELIAQYKEYFAIEDRDIKNGFEEINSKLLGPNKEMTNLEQDLEMAKKNLAETNSSEEKSVRIIFLEEKLKSLRLAKDTIMRELGRLEGEISANKRVIEKEEERQKKEDFQTVYLKDVEELIGRIEMLRSMADAKELFFEVVKVLKGFVAGHRVGTDSNLIGEAKNEIEKIANRKEKLESELSQASEEEEKILRECQILKNEAENGKDANRQAEKDIFRIIARQNELRGFISSLNVRLDELRRREENFKRELGEAAVIAGREATQYDRGPLSPRLQRASLPSTSTEINRAELLKKIERNKVRLEDSGGSGGSEVMKEYKETEERDAFLAKEIEDLQKAKRELLKLIAELDGRIDFEFKNGIMKINAEFQKYFMLMFGGGRAELSLVKETRRRKPDDAEDLNNLLNNDPNEMPTQAEADGPEGLDVNVSLPRKKVKGLMMLSGGERALTSIALLFAVSQVNPPPFIILDETDAALDEANSKKYGDMIENLSKHSELILITHNRETMSRAGVLYGVTMGSDGASKLLSLAFDEAVAVAK